MARYNSIWQLTSTALGILLATTWTTPNAPAQTTYDFVNSGNNATVDWHDSANWDPTGIPNAAGDEAIFTRPTVTPSTNFSILADQDTTVGAITIDSSGHTDNSNFVIDGFGTLIFETVSGSAALNANEDGGSPNADRITIWNDISVVSDLVITFAHKSNLNSSGFINSLITGSSDRTITKEGLANLQMSAHGVPGFEGQWVINDGGIRFIGSANLDQSAGVTVNDGGQLQFNANEVNPTYDWSLADGAVLTLNGSGKTGGSASGGALRFQGQAGHAARHANFHNPVVFETDTEIAVGPAQVTGELTNVVSGDGGLLKSAPGILVLSNPGNSYAGNTTLGDGILSLTSPFLSDDADVLVFDGTTLNLDHSDTDTIRSLFIDGVAQEAGLWGGSGNGDADFQTDIITGFGLLEVLMGPGLQGDFDDNGIVDAADYTVWRDHLGGDNPLGGNGDEEGDSAGVVDEADYQLWLDNFGNTAAGSGLGLAGGAVPEPGTLVLLLVGLVAAGGTVRRPT